MSKTSRKLLGVLAFALGAFCILPSVTMADEPAKATTEKVAPSPSTEQTGFGAQMEKPQVLPAKDKTDPAAPVKKDKAPSTTPVKKDKSPSTSPAKKDGSQPVKTPRVRSHNQVQANVVATGRYVPVFLAWVNEPYITYRAVPDVITRRIVIVPVVNYTRRLVQVYYDQWTDSYGYFDVWGNPVPYVRSW